MTMSALAVLAARRQEFVGFLERRLRDRPQAEDLYQEVYARSIVHIDALRDEERAVAWFYRALRRALIDRHRRSRAEQSAIERSQSEAPAHSPAIEHALDGVCRCVGRVAAELKPEYASALRAIVVEEQGVAAYARASGLTANHAGVRVFRARQALRRSLEQACGSCLRDGCASCSCGS
jgi:RNA polymerase sigma-70 factor (ECF subfamily)